MYHVRAKTGNGGESNNTAELTVNVERYVLPNSACPLSSPLMTAR